ncbi:MAG: ABC transporter permease [Eubacteriales bacterium]|nr:ABC transporter permease [Eubacteriales bacterium]MDD3880976.1 ABC transporter permease [Eubacteriales bacterium]MDD4511955.1 ABC transporter permease [Eubacteriales bacterium]
MKWLAFASRNFKEMTRDLLTLIFGIALPVVLIVMFSLISSNIGAMTNPSFMISNLAPGIAVFSMSFVTLFLGLLVAGDRSSAFLARILVSPMKGIDYILGYSLPLVPLALVQALACIVTAVCFGLKLSANLLFGLVALIPVSLLYISMGLLFGSVCSDKQVGGLASILINLAAWTSGAWFPVSVVGGVYETICNLLPFGHAVSLVQGVMQGSPLNFGHLIWVLGYAAALSALAIFFFKKKTRP